jgi:hypothetical protein
MSFKKGISGCPEGRPKGALNKRTQLAKLLEPHAVDLINKAVELAKGGDVNALRLCLERLISKPKDAPVHLELPEGSLDSTNTILQIGERIIMSVADGELTPEQGQKITTIIEAQRKTIETHDLAVRIGEIERTLKYRK